MNSYLFLSISYLFLAKKKHGTNLRIKERVKLCPKISKKWNTGELWNIMEQSEEYYFRKVTQYHTHKKINKKNMLLNI